MVSHALVTLEYPGYMAWAVLPRPIVPARWCIWRRNSGRMLPDTARTSRRPLEQPSNPTSGRLASWPSVYVRFLGPTYIHLTSGGMQIWTGFPLKTAKRVEQQGRTALMGSRADVEDLLRPTRQQYGSDAVSDAMWGELEKCWKSNPDSRPTMTALLVSRLFNETVVDEADEEATLYPRRSVRR